jgi:hypothetical protein
MGQRFHPYGRATGIGLCWVWKGQKKKNKIRGNTIMRNIVLAAGLALACLAAPHPAEAQSYGNSAFTQAFGRCSGRTCVVRFNPGGELETFLAASAAVRAGAKRLVVIDGPCYSACAIFADLTRDKVCITERASFGFHKARVFASLRGSRGRRWREVARHDPKHSRDIASWVYRNGGFPSNGFTVMGPRAASRFWRKCEIR